MKKSKFILLSAMIFTIIFGTYVWANSTTPSFDVTNGFAGAITSDGSLLMWGKNEYGEFGNGTTGIPEYGKRAEFEKTADNMKQIALGRYSSAYMLSKDGTLYGSGKNYSYNLGIGTNDDALIPEKIMDNVVMVGAGSEFALALKSDGTLWGWGDPFFIGLEPGSYIEKPVKIYDNVKTFSCGSQFSALITTDGKLYAAGNGVHGNLGIGKEAAEDVTRVGFTYVADNMKSVSCGAYNMLAIDNSGALWSCGKNTYGTLLNGTTGDNAYTLQKVVDSGVKSAAVFQDDAVYITDDAILYGTGNNLDNQLGYAQNYEIDSKGIIQKIAENVTDVALGWQNMLYRTTDGTLYMTGSHVDTYGVVFYGKMPMLKNVADNTAAVISAPPVSDKVIQLQIGSNKLINEGNVTTIDVPAQIINSRTMVPLRAIFEALDAEVNWDGDTRTITSTKNDITVKMQIGSNILYKNSEEKVLDVPAQIVDSRTLVPVRAIAEAYDCKVEWDGTTQTVTIVK
ncbi:MAG: stalk domain-containing protein [Lachnospirales bacterium]